MENNKILLMEQFYHPEVAKKLSHISSF